MLKQKNPGDYPDIDDLTLYNFDWYEIDKSIVRDSYNKYRIRHGLTTKTNLYNMYITKEFINDLRNF